jgi:YD repeat-containing protein
VVKLFQFRSAVACAVLLWSAITGLSQSSENSAVRVTVSMNADGSRTVYNFNDAQHKATATTTDQDGKLREKIHYDMDDLGRFSSGTIFGRDGRLRFKSRYKYDNAGRLQEETQSTEDGTILHRIVYSYDSSGKRTGYSVFDANGKLLGRTSPSSSSPTASPKSRAKTLR